MMLEITPARLRPGGFFHVRETPMLEAIALALIILAIPTLLAPVRAIPAWFLTPAAGRIRAAVLPLEVGSGRAVGGLPAPAVELGRGSLGRARRHPRRPNSRLFLNRSDHGRKPDA